MGYNEICILRMKCGFGNKVWLPLVRAVIGGVTDLCTRIWVFFAEGKRYFLAVYTALIKVKWRTPRLLARDPLVMVDALQRDEESHTNAAASTRHYRFSKA